MARISRWRIESGLLGADVVGANTLTKYGSATTDTTNYVIGAASISLDGNFQWLKSVDSALSANFPFKNGTSNKVIGFTCHFRKTTASTSAFGLAGKIVTATAGAFGINIANNKVQVVVGGLVSPTSVTLAGAYTITQNLWYHLGVNIDGPNHVLNWVLTGSDGTILEEFSADFGQVPAVNAVDFTVGVANSAAWIGNIDDAQVWNEVLSNAQIEAIRTDTAAPTANIYESVFVTEGQDPPTGFTERWNTTSATWATVADGDSPTGVTLRHTSTADGRRLLSWDELTNKSGNALEFLTSVRFLTKDGANSLNNFRFVFGASGAAAAETGIMALFNSTLENFGFFKYTAGTAGTAYNTTTFAAALNTTYLIRCRYEPQDTTSVIRLKIWAASGAEPGSWTASSSQSTWNGMLTGWNGIGNFDKDNTFEVDWMTAADLGGTAPLPSFSVEPDVEHLKLTGYAPETFPVSPSAESLEITGYAPAVNPTETATGELLLTGYTPTVYLGLISAPPTKRLYVRGYPPTIFNGNAVTGDSTFFLLDGTANVSPSHLGYGAGAFSLATSYGEAIKKHDAVGNGAFFVPTCTAKTYPQHLGHGNAAFSLLTGKAGTSAVGNSSFAFLTGEGTTVHGHAATGNGAFFPMAGTGATGSKGAGAFNLLTGTSQAVKGQIITGVGAFSFLTGTGETTKGHVAIGSGALFLLAGAGGSVKGHLATGSAALRLLTGSGTTTKGHGATGDGDLFLMAGTGQAGVRNDATGDGAFSLLKGSGMLDTTDPDYILHYRSPT